MGQGGRRISGHHCFLCRPEVLKQPDRVLRSDAGPNGAGLISNIGAEAD